MLCMAAEKQMQLTNQVKGIVFYSVPHRGSYLINRTRNASYLIHPTDALLQLAEGRHCCYNFNNNNYNKSFWFLMNYF